MTTPAAERLYLAQHLYSVEGKGWALFNPHDKPLEELPVIYGFNNGGTPGLLHAVAIAEDGTCLGGHGCSHEGFMPYDLGIIDGHRRDRHEKDYKRHYPEGYRMEFVPSDEIKGHEKLNAAFKLNRQMPEVTA